MAFRPCETPAPQKESGVLAPGENPPPRALARHPLGGPKPSPKPARPPFVIPNPVAPFANGGEGSAFRSHGLPSLKFPISNLKSRRRPRHPPSSRTRPRPSANGGEGSAFRCHGLPSLKFPFPNLKSRPLAAEAFGEAGSPPGIANLPIGAFCVSPRVTACEKSPIFRGSELQLRH
jgi:hypothetical protein